MSPTKRLFFYGYLILTVAFICNFFSNGAMYAFSLFVKPLEAATGWSRVQIMLAPTIGTIAMGIASPLVGRLVDRYGSRLLIAGGALMVGVGFTLLSRMQQLWHLYLVYAVITVGFAAVGMVPASVLVTNWFKKRRGWAIGIMGIGVGAGGMVISPIVGIYLIPQLGFRAAYLILGLMTAIFIVPLALFAIKEKPENMGLLPDGVQHKGELAGNSKDGVEKEAISGLTLRQTLRTSAFWLIAFSFVAFSSPMMAVFQNHAAYLEEIGYSVSTVAAAIGVVGFGSGIGKFGFGWITDWIKPKYSLVIGILFQAVAIVLLLIMGTGANGMLLWVYAVIFGIGIGVWLPCISLLVSVNFGLAAYGTILGVMYMVYWLGAATGPVIAGAIYDTTGSYRLAFIIFLVMDACAIAAIMMLRRPKSFRP